jgi:ribosome maturation factor RimP
MSDSVPHVTEVIRSILDTLGFRLYDVHFNDVTRLLRVFIDREEGGITIEDCKNVSKQISRELDSGDLLHGRYTLEVSSPGVERALKRMEHYVWAIGKFIEVDCGDKKLRGYLRRAQGTHITIATDLGESTIPYDAIVKAKVMEELEYGKRR